MKKFVSDLYRDSDILIRKKVQAFFISLLTFLVGTTVYFLYQIFSGTAYSQDLPLIALTILVLLSSFGFLVKGHYYVSSILIFTGILIPTTTIVWFGHTLNELKLYNMAFLHSIGIIYSVLISENKRQIFYFGAASVVALSLFLLFRLIPSADGDLFPYYSTFLVVVIFELMETIVGFLIFRVLNDSLNEVKHMAEFDVQTSLPNANRLAIDVKRGSSSREQRYLVFYKLENYTELLLNTGTDITLKLIVKCAEMIAEFNRSTVYRTSVDILCSPVSLGEGEAEERIKKILTSFRTPLIVDEMHIHIHLRVTMMKSNTGDFDVQQSINNGLLALYQARSEKKSFMPFEKEREKIWKDRLSLLNELSLAISKSYFTIVYQPIFDLSKNIVAAEALSRWNNRAGRDISPETFIPMLEQSGLMNEFFLMMVAVVLRDMKSCQSLKGDFPVYINLSPELINHNFDFSQLVSLIDKARIPHHRIGFEITESSMLEDESTTETVLEFLRSEEFPLALDDFGTGYSNMTRILHLPFRKIKFDRTFLTSMEGDKSNGDLLELLISYFNDLGFVTLIEGIESEGEFNLLKEFGCREFQGFLLGRPELPR